jgi:hypothetical protein
MNVQQAKDGAAVAARIGVDGEDRAAVVGASRARAGMAIASRGAVSDPPMDGALGDMVARLGGRAPVRPLHAGLVQTSGPARAGYASAGASQRASAAPTASASRTTSASHGASSSRTTSAAAKKELAFLDDKTLSIEEKLFRFMILMQQKADQELVQAMKGYEAKKSTAAAKAAKTSKAAEGGGAAAPAQKKDGGGGGLFGFIGDAVGGLGKAVVSGAETLAKDLGGPALAAGATALGMPWLAPAALQIGGPIATGLVDGVASFLGADAGPATGRGSSSSGKSTSSGGSRAPSSGSSASSSAPDEVFDEKVEAMKLQQLVEKQSAMFNTISNILKSMHDTQMNAIGNIR